MRTFFRYLLGLGRRLRDRRGLHRGTDLHDGAAERLVGEHQAAMHANHHRGTYSGGPGF